MKNNRSMLIMFTFLVAVLLLAACAKAPTAPVSTETAMPIPVEPTITSTPDPCAPENIAAEIRPIHRLMREFDDAAALSTNANRDQLKPIIADLQRIRRDAEDQVTPECLRSFKELQVVHMNTYIQTLIMFTTGSTDEAGINQGIALSRQLHDQYMIEMARLQGEYIQPTMVSPVSTQLDGTPAADATEIPPTPTVAVVTNMGPGGINIRIEPSLGGQTVSMLAVNQSALALGQTENGTWIMIEVPGQPGQTAWVYAALVQISGPTPLPSINVKP